MKDRKNEPLFDMTPALERMNEKEKSKRNRELKAKYKEKQREKRYKDGKIKRWKPLEL